MTLLRRFASLSCLGPLCLMVLSLAAPKLCAQVADVGGDSGIVNPRAKAYGAKGDGVADDTAALRAAADEARRRHTLLFLPAGTYRMLTTLDVTGLEVVGAGRDSSVLKLDGTVQKDAVTSRGNTLLRDLQIFGGWDGRTPGQAGSGFVSLSDPVGKPPYLGYEVRLDNVSIQYSKAHCVEIVQGSYQSLHNVKCNAAAQNGLMLESGKNAGFATTTVNVDGLSTFSDLGGYGVYIQDGMTVSLSGRTVMENTQGIRLAGGNGRTLKISGVHQENTRGGKFLTAADSSGIGLMLVDNFFAGSPILPEAPNELDHWFNVTVDGNAIGGLYGTGAPVAVKALGTPDAEPVEVVPGGWRFQPGQPTVMGLLQHPRGAAWSARLVGNWITGDSTPTVAHEFLLTGAHPVAQVGPTAFRLSLDGNGRLVGNVSSTVPGPFEFQGVVELVVDRQHGASQDVAIETAAGARLGSARVSALAGKGSAPVCAAEDGTLYRCSR